MKKIVFKIIALFISFPSICLAEKSYPNFSGEILSEIRTDKKIKEAKSIFDEKITYVNENYKERLYELNSTVKEFVDKEFPKYSSLLLESKIKSDDDVKNLEIARAG